MSKRLLAGLLCCLLLAGCSRGPKTGQGFRFPLAGEPRTLDPQIASDPAALTVIQSLFEGLVTLKEGEPVPAAARWELSSDGLRYTFTLFPGCWGDGTPLRADDFLFAYQRTADPATGSPHRQALAGVAAVTAPGEDTLEITLAAPDDRFLYTLAAGALYPCPRAFFAGCGGGYGMEPETLQGNGPFKLVQWDHGKYLLLHKNGGYRNAAAVSPGAVRYVLGAAGLSDLKEGRVDGAQLSPAEGAAWPRRVTVEDTVTLLRFNLSREPLQDPAVREALRDGIEWERLDPLLPGVPTRSFLPPAAGIPSDLTAPATRATPGLGLPALTLLCPEGEEWRQAAQVILQSWQKNLGAYFRLEQLPADTLAARLAAGEYQLAVAPFTPAPGSRETLERQERELRESCAAVPLTVTPRIYGLSKDITGVEVEPFTGRFIFLNAKR